MIVANLTRLHRLEIYSYLKAFRSATKLNLRLQGDRYAKMTVHKAIRFYAGQTQRNLVRLNKVLEMAHMEDK